jgi:hypothetical protein
MMNRKLLSGIFGVILLFSLFFSCDRPQKSGMDFDSIDTSGDPIQTSYKSEDPIVKEIKNGQFTITQVAEYKLSGMVVSKEIYSDDWGGKISPVDLAIVWGKLAEPEYAPYITYSQSNRWYFYQYKPDSPFDNSYVISHSANNHIIPANENIVEAVKTIGKGDRIVLEGFLVNIKGTYEGRPVTRNTSMTRKDTGDGSCEIVYVTKIRVNTDVYE